MQLAHEILLGDFHIVEHDATGASSPAPHQAVDVVGADARTAIHHQAGDAVARFGLGIGARVDQEVVGRRSANDKALLAVEQKVIAAILRHGRGAEEVGSAARLGEALGCEDLTAQQGRNVLFLLGIRTVQHDRVAHQLGADTKCAGKDVAEDADLFHHHGGAHPVEVATTPPFRIAAAHQIALPRLTQEVAREVDLVGVHVEDQLAWHRLDEGAHLVAQSALFWTEREIEHPGLQSKNPRNEPVAKSSP